MNHMILLTAALLPAVVLGIYIYIKDRAEKEPIGLLIRLLVLGALICFPAAMLEEIADSLIFNIFAGIAVVQDGILVLPNGLYHLYCLICNIIGVAVIEEGLKWICMWFVTSKNKNFNSLFDGVIYAVFVSLGFAALENVLYVFNYGWATAVARMVTAVPAHTFFAVIMGYFYTTWHMLEKAGKKEKNYIANGMIAFPKPVFSGTPYLVLSFIMPVLAHGFYDYCCTVEEGWANILFYIFLIFLYVYCFKKVRSLSHLDGADESISDALILGKYPELSGYYGMGIMEEERESEERVNDLDNLF